MLTLVDIDFDERELIDTDWRRRLRQMLWQHDPFQLFAFSSRNSRGAMHMTIDD